MIRAYIVDHDIGFAPNPFHGVCTLATCKPKIRKQATVGDWIVGVGSCNDGIRGRMVFAMQVEERLTFQEYWDEERFKIKKPNFSGSLMQAQGDNVYHKENGAWIQERSRHTHANAEMTERHKQRDTGYDGVLTSTRFVYFGQDAINIPTQFIGSNGRRLRLDGTGTPSGGLQRGVNFDDPNLTARFEAWLEKEGKWGRLGEPCEWIKKNKIGSMLENETFGDGWSINL